MRRLIDALLSQDPSQRLRLLQALLAIALMAAGALALHYFAWIGIAPVAAVRRWSVAAIAGMTLIYALIRSGWSRRLADPALTVAQMLYAVSCAAAAYALLGAGRGGVFPVVMAVLMFGMFVATPLQMVAVSLYSVVLFGATMAWMAHRDPAVYAPAIELGHFIMVATLMPAVSLLAVRLCRMRQTESRQRAELTHALERIRELATHDELTGLINRRHLEALMAQEHQRCIRSGHTFCIAVIEFDAFAALAERLGPTGTDALLQGLAQEALRFVRVADALGHWGGARFVLLMSDTHAVLARGGLERLRERLAAAPVLAGEPGVGVTAGLAEHHAGETVEQTLARAEGALAEARAAGPGRLMVAP